MNVGIVVDLRNYEEYQDRFRAIAPEFNDALEIHLVMSDLNEPDEYMAKMRGTARFSLDRGLKYIAYHLPDSVLNNIFIRDIIEGDSLYGALIPVQDHASDVAKLKLILRGLAEAASIMGRSVNAVVHEGVYFDSSVLGKYTASEIGQLRSHLISRIQAVHERLFSDSRSYCRILLENSPPYASLNSNKEHFLDQCGSDIILRLQAEERMVFDVSHAFMTENYIRNGTRGVRGLDIFYDTPQAADACDFLEKHSSSIGCVHLSDCVGISAQDEGRPLFSESSIVNWDRFLPLLNRIEVPIIIEIVGAENNFDHIRRSVLNLKERWGSVLSKQ